MRKGDHSIGSIYVANGCSTDQITEPHLKKSQKWSLEILTDRSISHREMRRCIRISINCVTKRITETTPYVNVWLSPDVSLQRVAYDDSSSTYEIGVRLTTLSSVKLLLSSLRRTLLGRPTLLWVNYGMTRVTVKVQELSTWNPSSKSTTLSPGKLVSETESGHVSP